MKEIVMTPTGGTILTPQYRDSVMSNCALIKSMPDQRPATEGVFCMGYDSSAGEPCEPCQLCVIASELCHNDEWHHAKEPSDWPAIKHASELVYEAGLSRLSRRKLERFILWVAAECPGEAADYVHDR